MTAQPADECPVRDAGPVRLLRAVPDPPPVTAPKPPKPPSQPAAETPDRPFDRVAVTLLATPLGGLTAATIGHWWALGVWAAIWVALVVWTAKGVWARD